MTTKKRAGRSQKPVTKKPTKTPAKAAKSPQKAKGRPQGAKTREYPPGNEIVTRCIDQTCNSTEKEPVGNPQTVETEANAPDGRPCNQIVLRRVKCTACSQIRIDREYRFVKPAKKSA